MRIRNYFNNWTGNINNGDMPILSEDFQSLIVLDRDATIDIIQSVDISITFATSGHVNGVTKRITVVSDSVHSVGVPSQTSNGIPVRKRFGSFVSGEINAYWFTYYESIGGIPVIEYAIEQTTQFTTDSLTVFGLFPDSVDTELKTIFAAFIDTCVNDGNWNALDCVEMIRNNTSPNALIDWKDSFTLTNNSAVFSKSGFGFTGANYINSGYNPSTSTLLTQNDCGFGFWNVSNAGGSAAFGNLASGLTIFLGRDPGNGLRYRIQNSIDTLYTGELTFAANANYAIERTGASATAMRKDGTVVKTGTTASQSMPNSTIAIGARNNTSVDSFYSGTIGCFYTFKPSIFNHSNFNTAIHTMMASLDTYFAAHP